MKSDRKIQEDIDKCIRKFQKRIKPAFAGK
jgi:hypothetical protein